MSLRKLLEREAVNARDVFVYFIDMLDRAIEQTIPVLFDKRVLRCIRILVILFIYLIVVKL